MKEEETREKVKDSIAIRGVCAAVQAMSMPTIYNLQQLLEHAGYRIIIQKINN